MAIFKYEALEDGERRTGMLAARDIAEAGNDLRSRGLVPVSISEAQESSVRLDGERGPVERWIAGRLTWRVEIEHALFQMSALLGGGVPVTRALTVVASQCHPYLGRALLAVAERLRQGAALGESVRRECAFFGDVVIGLIAVGEANGTLDEMCRYAAELLRRRRRITTQIGMTMIYPAILVAAVFGVGYYMAVKVIPLVVEFIRLHGGQLHWVPQMLLDAAYWFARYGPFMAVTPPLLLLFYLFTRRTEIGARSVDRIIIAAPVVGPAFREAANALWCRTLAVLLRSGVNLVSALKLTRNTMANRHYRRQFDEMDDHLRRGNSFSASLQLTSLARLHPLASAMVNVGEGTGTVDESLFHAAEFAEERLVTRISFIQQLLYPIMIILIAVVVTAVYYSYFLAVMSAIRSLR